MSIEFTDFAADINKIALKWHIHFCLRNGFMFTFDTRVH